MPTYTLQGPDVVIVSSSVANPSVITTATPHGFTTGNSVVIAGHTGSTPNINGTHVVTVTGSHTFTIPQNVTVGGTEGRATSTRTPTIETLEVTWAINQTDVLRCKFKSEDLDYIPAKYSKTYLYEDATVIFGGTVSRVFIQGLNGHPTGRNVQECVVEAVSFKAKLKNRYITLTTPAGTALGTILAAIESGGFLPSGLSISGAQAAGPTIDEELVWEDLQLSAAFDQLSELTGWPYDVHPDETVEMFEPGATAAPYDITFANKNADGDVAVERAALGGPNQIIVKAGTATTVDKTFVLTGDGVTDTYPLKYPVAGPYPNLPGGAVGYGVLVNVTQGTTEAIAAVPLGGYNWEYDATAGPHGTIRRVIGGAPATGDVYTFTYLVQFPITVRVPAVAPADVVERVIHREDVFDYDVAFAIGTAELALATSEPDTIRYDTLAAGYIKPGQTQTIDVEDERDTDVTATITEVNLRNTQGNIFLRSITAVSGETGVSPIYRKHVRGWLERGTGSSAGPGAAVSVGGGVPGLPVYAVQFNYFGRFGGDEAFKYFPVTNSLVCGDLSSITAASPESCQAFGYDCHIADL